MNVKILYPRRQAIETAKKAIKEKMEQDLEKIQDKLDKLLGLEWGGCYWFHGFTLSN